MGATRNAYRLVLISWRLPLGEWPFGRLKMIWESRIMMGLKEMDCEDG
jgi:hypothetical protein